MGKPETLVIPLSEHTATLEPNQRPTPLSYIATQSNTSATSTSMNNNRPQIQANLPLPKCMVTAANPQSTDYGLTSTTTHQAGASRVTKQTASGDTGDGNSACEQPKEASTEQTSVASIANPSFSNPTDPSGIPNRPSIAGSNQPAPTTQVSETNATSATSVAENKTNLIINYLPPNMSQEEVRALFSSIGDVESCKLVREKTSGESLGYAFVKFYDPADAGKAIKTLNGLRLQNKTVKVSLARPSSEAIKGANLYICGLPRKMTQPELEKLFSSCGHIITARILYDTKTGLSRGVAFIRYDQRAEAEVAIRRLNGYLPPGASEPITVKFANSPSANRSENLNFCFVKQNEHEPSSRLMSACGPSNATTVGSLTGLGGGQVGEGGSNSLCRPPSNAPLPGVSVSTAHSGPTSGRSYMTRNPNTAGLGGRTPPPGFMFQGHRSNLGPVCAPPCNNAYAYGATVDSAGNTASLVGQPNGCFQAPVLPSGHNISINGGNISSGITSGRQDVGPLQRLAGVARLKCHAAAVAAAAISGGTGVGFRASGGVLGGPMDPAFPNGLPTFGMDFMRGLGSSAHALLAPAFAASSGALTATGWCIFVYNLAPDTEDSILWQLFGPFGAVQTVKVIRDPVTGKCKGFGFVTMSNYEEALLAIHSLNGFNLGNRVLQVSFKTTPNSRHLKYMSNTTDNIPVAANVAGPMTPVPGNFTQNTT